MKTKSVIILAILIALALIMAIVLRGSNQAMQNPTINFSDIRTAAVGTYAYSLTQTMAVPPSATSTLAATVTSTPIRATATQGTETPTPSCYHLRWIKDETIPDFSRMQPGESFTKTWLVINNGTCTWKAGFQFAFYGGDPMGGSNYTLTQPVTPGQQMDLSIPMTAPSGTGIEISTWRMSDITGWFFGDALTVKIDLGGETPTP
jgi:Ig-like domain from next to BRCA1 gene